MTRHLNKDTTLCMSLAARPSNFGTRFHNYLYDAMELDYLYKAFTTTDLAGAIAGVRALGVRGCAISMPFKEQVIALVDELDASAATIHSVNTVVNTEGHLKAYNTDYIAIATLLRQYQVDNQLPFILRGSGGMAKAVACALKDAGFLHGKVVDRKPENAARLAQLYGFDSGTELGDSEAGLLINATPIGMAGGAEASRLAFSLEEIKRAEVVFDVVALPETTPLIHSARELGKTVITGAEVFAIQAVEQFALYTGKRPDEALFREAAAYSRQ